MLLLPMAGELGVLRGWGPTTPPGLPQPHGRVSWPSFSPGVTLRLARHAHADPRDHTNELWAPRPHDLGIRGDEVGFDTHNPTMGFTRPDFLSAVRPVCHCVYFRHSSGDMGWSCTSSPDSTRASNIVAWVRSTLPCRRPARQATHGSWGEGVFTTRTSILDSRSIPQDYALTSSRSRSAISWSNISSSNGCQPLVPLGK